MRVDFGGANARMAQQDLNEADINAVLQKPSRVAVEKCGGKEEVIETADLRAA